MADPTADPFLAFVMSQRVNFLAPFLTGAFAECIATGVVLDQLGRYLGTSWHSARVVERVVVLFVCAVAIFQTCAAIWDIWHVHVAHFGDWLVAIDLGWPDKMQPVVTATMSTPVQWFLILRVSKAWNKKIWAFIPLALLQLTSVISAIVKTNAVFHFNFAAPPPPPPGTPLPPLTSLPPAPIDPVFVTFLASTSALDMLTTGLLVAYLMQSRTKTESSYTRDLIRRLTLLVWQSALPPCLTALGGVICYVSAPASFWDLLFQSVLGKFYVISLLVTLNGRTDIIASMTTRNATEDVGASVAPSARSRRRRTGQLAINVDVETMTHTEIKSPRSARGGGDDGFDDEESAYKMHPMRSPHEMDSPSRKDFLHFGPH